MSSPFISVSRRRKRSIASSRLTLVGVVAVNVAVLRLNMQIEKLGQQRLALEAQNALLESKVSSTLAPARIEREARTKLGLLPAAEPTYVELRPRR